MQYSKGDRVIIAENTTLTRHIGKKGTIVKLTGFPSYPYDVMVDGHNPVVLFKENELLPVKNNSVLIAVAVLLILTVILWLAAVMFSTPEAKPDTDTLQPLNDTVSRIPDVNPI